MSEELKETKYEDLEDLRRLAYATKGSENEIKAPKFLSESQLINEFKKLGLKMVKTLVEDPTVDTSEIETEEVSIPSETGRQMLERAMRLQTEAKRLKEEAIVKLAKENKSAPKIKPLSLVDLRASSKAVENESEILKRMKQNGKI